MTNPTQPDSWLDSAITYYVNRGLINEDRWNDLKAAILQHEAQAVELAELRGRIKEIDVALEVCRAHEGESPEPGSQLWNAVELLTHRKHSVLLRDYAALRAGKEKSNED